MVFLTSWVLQLLLSISALTPAFASDLVQRQDYPRQTCIVPAGGSNATDDAPAIVQAFKDCGSGGKVVFTNTTYYVNSVMTTTDLEDCEIDLQGTLLWSTDIPYWLNNSIPIGYQNQSTAWMFGGNNIKFNGNGYGTFDGNGQYWYDFIHGQSNYPGRPHAFTIWGANDSTLEGLRFVQSQMWTMSILYSHNTTLDSIYVNSTSHSSTSTSNTDGADTFFSSHITFSNWKIVNGDDSISTKANSTDITIRDCEFHRGLGVAIGSIGQYKGRFETIERLHVENVTYYGTKHAIYFKTWTGVQVGYPPNGGGGGSGYATDITGKNLIFKNMTGAPISISQCTQFSGGGEPANCTNSLFALRNLSFTNLTGTSTTATVGSFQCSAVEPCRNIEMDNVDISITTGNRTGEVADKYLCGHVEGTVGFECNGPVCEGGSSTGGC